MKTNIFFSRNTTLYSLIGFLSVLVTSCGSYQNSSYYDTDGIYGNTPREAQNASNNRYKEYFSSLQTENSTNDTIQNIEQGYPSWGSNPSTTSINVYTNPWNMGFGMGWGNGFGWGDPFFGMGWGNGFGWGGGFGWGWGYPVWGWGNPGWGWGWGNLGWGYPAYGFNNNYSYNSSRRGSSYSNGVYGNNRYSQSATNSNRRGTNYTDYGRSSNNNDTRNSSSFMTRDYSTSQNNSSRTRTNTNTNTNSSRGQNYAPTRSYSSPSSNSYYSGGRSSGGGGGSYSGGSGRSTGGGGGRR
jgi:hypothetical protein